MSASRKFRRALANQRNAQNSTGPKTEAGKAISSQNARTHGLTSKQIVLPGEDPQEFEDLKHSLYNEYRPKTEIEKALVDEYAASFWRLNRARRVETAFLAKLAENSPYPETAIALGILEKPKEMERLMRYIAAIERAYNRALTNLHKVMKAIQQAALQNAYAEAAGFVLQNASEQNQAIVSDTPETAEPELPEIAMAA